MWGDVPRKNATIATGLEEGKSGREFQKVYEHGLTRKGLTHILQNCWRGGNPVEKGARHSLEGRGRSWGANAVEKKSLTAVG